MTIRHNVLLHYAAGPSHLLPPIHFGEQKRASLQTTLRELRRDNAGWRGAEREREREGERGGEGGREGGREGEREVGREGGVDTERTREGCGDDSLQESKSEQDFQWSMAAGTITTFTFPFLMDARYCETYVTPLG